MDTQSHTGQTRGAGQPGSTEDAVVLASSWSAGLEAWARARWSEQMIPVGGTMDFAPLGTERPRAFFEVPVVILVMTRATAQLHRALFRAVELLRESTYGFRAVLFTDDVGVAESAEVDWTLEHTMSEDEWSRVSAENWLTQAAEHLAWAQRQYGASLVLAPETPEQVRAAVARLGAAFLAAEKVRRTAATLAEQELDGLDETRELSSRRSRSVRGWWSQLGAGRSTVRAEWGAGARLKLVIDRRDPGEGLLVGPEGEAVEAFLSRGRESGFSTVTFEVEQGEAVDVQGGLETAIRAAVEVLGDSGPSLFVAAAASNVDRAADRGLDGVVRLGGQGAGQDAGRGTGQDAGHDVGQVSAARAGHELVMSYGSSLRFAPEQTVEVLTRLSRLHHATV